MRIARDIYLEKLKRGIGNGMIKVITGIRRCGKSYLLSELFREYLASIGIDEPHIIEVALDDRANAALRDPDAMMNYVKSRITDSGQYFILLDEVQDINALQYSVVKLLFIKVHLLLCCPLNGEVNGTNPISLFYHTYVKKSNYHPLVLHSNHNHNIIILCELGGVKTRLHILT